MKAIFTQQRLPFVCLKAKGLFKIDAVDIGEIAVAPATKEKHHV
jgi:hypothetical protein